MSTHAGDPSATPAGDQAAFLPPVTPIASTADKAPAETRPELVVGVAFAGGLLLARLLGRARGH